MSLLIFWLLVKVGSENSIFIPMDSVIMNFWKWLFGGAKYQGGDEAGTRGTEEQ